jgi:hypothetical protein
MKNVLIYYGYLNSFNSAVNGWNNDNVVDDIGGKYDICVFGDGLQDPAHPDYANTTYILNKLMTDYPGIEIFGYVTVNQPLQDFQAKANQWDTLNIQGIFFDEAGYDFGKTREELNQRIKFVREMNGDDKIFVNSWNIDHVIGTNDDPSFPNSTYNPSAVASDLLSTDYYLLENFTVVNSTYESTPQWFIRGNKAKMAQSTHGIKPMAVSILDDADPNGQEKFNNIFYGAHLWNLEGVGSSHLNYGATDAKVNFWARPGVSHL